MRHVYFTRVSAQLGFVTCIKQQPLPQLVTGHVKMTVSLGPQGTLVTGTKTETETMKSYRRHVLGTCISSVLTNGTSFGAHRSVLVTGFYATCYIVSMFVMGVLNEAHVTSFN
jgi:hypothetical protein